MVCLGIGGARSGPGRHRNAPSRCGERWFARAGHGESGVVQLLRARGPTHPPWGGSPTPGATAMAPQRRSSLPQSAAAGHAVAATARWRPRHDLPIDPGRRFRRPRKAVERPRKPKTLIHGRAIGASHARLARRWVSRLARPLRPALSAALAALRRRACQSGNRKRLQQWLLLQASRYWRNVSTFNSQLAESARLMPVTASPMPAHAGAQAGLIS